MRRVRLLIIGLVSAVVAIALGVLVVQRLNAPASGPQRSEGPKAAPVEVSAVERGPIRDRRVFSGTLEAVARVTIAPKVAGRIVSLPVDIADTVRRGDVVARLDGAELEQMVMQAEAELAVARAGQVEAENAATIAQRELDRVTTLHERGIASDSQLDTVRADHLARNAAVQVALAQVSRAEAMLESARIRLGYTTIRAEWEEGDDARVVAERFVEEGDTVSANTPLLTIIELDPIEAVIDATERDYAQLAPGQEVTLTTDAFPGRRWTGEVSRISPVFREGSRQARVRIRVENPEDALKPGMFVRVEAILGREDEATIVPVAALAERDGRMVVFVANQARDTARMVPVELGIRDGSRVQVLGAGVEGWVVTLGQQLLREESAITVPDVTGRNAASAAGDPESAPGAGRG